MLAQILIRLVSPPVATRTRTVRRISGGTMGLFLLVVLLLAFASLLSVHKVPGWFVVIELSPQSLSSGSSSSSSASSSSSSSSSSTVRVSPTLPSSSLSSATSGPPQIESTAGRSAPDPYIHNRSAFPNASLIEENNASSSVRKVSAQLLSSVLNQTVNSSQQLPFAAALRTPVHPPLIRRRQRSGNASGAEILSHVLERDASTGWWTPRLSSLGSLPAIDQGCFPAVARAAEMSHSEPSSNRTNSREYLGVVRITKTGSTSLLNFFNAAGGLQTWDKYLNFEVFEKTMAKGGLKTTLLTPPCVFGHHREPGTNASKGLPFPNYQCQHLSYYQVVNVWARSLAYLRENRFLDNQIVGHPNRPLRMTLDVVTILREPLERYLSYFHYWRSIYPSWNGTAQPLERQALIEGDFAAFVQHVSHAPHRGMNSAFQYEYLSHDVGYAVSLIEDGRILPLINECFNVSILLLQDRYPRFFNASETNSFLDSGKSVMNTRGTPQSNADVLAYRGLRPVQPFDMAELRQMARPWLAGDYRFYETGVAAFRSLLFSSRVDDAAIQACEARLESVVLPPGGDTAAKASQR